MKTVYDLVVIGGGISSCTFIANILKKGYRGKIALVEAGRGLGGRCSTRFSNKNKNWIFNHGAPNFNIKNTSRSSLLDNFIKEIFEMGFIKKTENSFFEFDENYNLLNNLQNEFYLGNVYIPNKFMSNFIESLVQSNNNKNQIDFYFDTLITRLRHESDYWIITSEKSKEIFGRFLVCSSNLLLHNRSLDILNVKQLPLRDAILKGKNKNIDQIIELVNKQSYIKRVNFLICAKSEFKLKGVFDKEVIHFISNKKAEEEIGIERIIFQKQFNSRTGIVIHTRNIDSFIKNNKKEDKSILNEYLINNLNKILMKNKASYQEISFDNVSIMNWRASQPYGKGIPERLQICKENSIAFCGDWFQFEGYGTVQAAILSGLELSNKLYTLIN